MYAINPPKKINDVQRIDLEQKKPHEKHVLLSSSVFAHLLKCKRARSIAAVLERREHGTLVPYVTAAEVHGRTLLG